MLVTCSIKRRTLPFTMSKPKMRRQIFVHVLFAWLLLAASAFNHVTANVQAIQSGVHFNPRTLQASPKLRGGHAIPSWVKEKKSRKSPSGPNPIGNHRPPSQPQRDAWKH
ncbi:CLAVATA3/ESR (CLE)-related protein 46 [Lotus japonicus]|uniref:CLAVATA3/ESR (CLE)-related protein 46 n=1 Tax=Lotus japonicus TaxID=34305 RepID=UPI002586600D|nr:CLAVATA3/ESR (CLE)-related protein 46 [Lotus japonicus]